MESEGPAAAPEQPTGARGPAGTPVAAKAREERFMLVAATFGSQDQARALVQRLEKDHLKARVVSRSRGGQTRYQVQVGPVTGAKAAEDLARRLQTKERITPRVMKMTATTSNDNVGPDGGQMSAPVLTTALPGFPRRQGKVRDIYDLGDRLLLVASDRISAFDVVMSQPIPDKGRILTRLSAFWFRHLAPLTPNHLISLEVEEFPPACRPYRELLQGRAMLARKCRPLPVECIVRGYLSGSGWAEYRQTGAIGGLPLPPGLVESQQLPEPLFTPSTKAELGTHDENISLEQMAASIGAPTGRPGQGPQPEPLPPGPGVGRTPGHHHRRHQVRVRPGGRRAAPHRRGAHPGLLPLLAPGGLPPRRPSKEL